MMGGFIWVLSILVYNFTDFGIAIKICDSHWDIMFHVPITSSVSLNYLPLNLFLRPSKNASLVLIVPGSGTGLLGLLDSLVTSSPSGISLDPPGIVNGMAIESLSSSLNCLEILLAVRLCMNTLLGFSAFMSFRMFSLLIRLLEKDWGSGTLNYKETNKLRRKKKVRKSLLLTFNRALWCNFGGISLFKSLSDMYSHGYGASLPSISFSETLHSHMSYVLRTYWQSLCNTNISILSQIRYFRRM